MGNNKWKPIVFTATVIVAFTLILYLFVHRSHQKERLCPNPAEVMYISPETGNGTCYREHTKGPCPSNMVLYKVPTNDSVGLCDCDYQHNDRGLIFHPETNQCYFLFSQAYCGPGKWLKPQKAESCQENLCAFCERNHCQQPFGAEEWVELKDGSCAALNQTHTSCKNPDDVIHFSKFKAFPSCEGRGKSFSVSVGSVGVPPTKCPHGYSRTSLGHCAPDFDFD